MAVITYCMMLNLLRRLKQDHQTSQSCARVGQAILVCVGGSCSLDTSET